MPLPGLEYDAGPFEGFANCRFLAAQHVAGVALKIGNSAFPDLREFGQMLAGPFQTSAGRSALQRGYFDRSAPVSRLF
jgi:hypothetical protein